MLLPLPLMRTRNALLLALALSFTQLLTAQLPGVDQELLAQIRQIKAVDNHAHVVKMTPLGTTDDDFDALPCPPEIAPLPSFWTRADENPLYLEAEKHLFAYQFSDMSAEHLKTLEIKKAAKKKELGDAYPAWVLDQIGTEFMLANRVAMGSGLAPPRVRWVAFDDALMYPLNNAKLRAQNPVKAFYFGREERLLRQYVKDAGNSALPATLDGYMSDVVTPTLVHQKRAGALAIKFEMAYLRTLDVEPAPVEEANRIYNQYIANGAVPPDAEYKLLQDFIFRRMALSAGALKLAVHIHTGGGGSREYNLFGGDAVRLDAVLNDPAMSKTVFVLLHGNMPNPQNIAYLIGKQNVYTDFSFENQTLPPRALAAVLRYWIEWYPEKVMYGSDLGPDNWEEQGYVANETTRQALALALTGMINDHEVTRARALELARMVLRENAVKLYGLR